MEAIKQIIIGILSVVLGYVVPITYVAVLLLVLFLANIGIGMIEGFIVKNENFEIKKFFYALVEVLLYFMITVFSVIAAILVHKEQFISYGLDVLSILFLYAYTVNILGNLKSLFPRSAPIKYFYHVVSVEFIKKIPFLQNKHLTD